MPTDTLLLKQLEHLLVQGSTDQSHWPRVLARVLAHFQSASGAVYKAAPQAGRLGLIAHIGGPGDTPDMDLAQQAAQQRQAVQTDAAAAVPVLAEKELLRGVLVVARSVAQPFTPAVLDRLGRIAEALACHLGRPTKREILDQYFIEARHKAIEVAAFLDRVDRAEGEDDFRIKAFRAALKELARSEPDRATRILLALSDPTTEPIPAAKGKSASGAWPGKD